MQKKTERNRKSSDKPTPASKLTELLDIPQSAMLGTSQIEISGNREAIVDGCQGVLEYDENTIRLTTGKMSIKFCGRGLQIKALTHTSAVVTGFINSIEFVN